MLIGKKRPKPQPLDCIVEIVHKTLKERGEDAHAYSFERDDFHAQAVFDGCGGSGSWQYAEYDNATGAFIAAHSMCRAFLAWFDAASPEILRDAGKMEASFHEMAHSMLSDLKSHCAPMRVSGSLVRAFPCTASVAVMAPGEGSLSVIALNVGDSRVYFLTPETGLVQLSVDDCREDPMESLRTSGPMLDMLNADRPFNIKRRQLELKYPCAVITATDGVFGYVRSPMDFESMLLDAIMRSDSFAGFEDVFREKVVSVTGDDSTCVMSFYGWRSFNAVRKALWARHKTILSIVNSLDEAMEQDALDTALDKIWDEYRKTTLYDEMKG